jgi:hypothetical protein
MQQIKMAFIYSGYDIVKLPNIVNYLHYGDALEYFCKVNLSTISMETVSLTDLILWLSSVKKPSDYVVSILQSKTSKSSNINIKKLIKDIHKTSLTRRIFNSLNCRGFSFKLLTDFQLPDKLGEHIDLYYMLIGCHDLFYPPRICNFLHRVENVHYKKFGCPSIAFALGTKSSTGWYILDLQSDFSFRDAYIRHHFRGWQRILFNIITMHAIAEGKDVFLPRSSDIVRTCYPAKNRPEKIPTAWKVTYDYTAKYFGMELVPRKESINCQVLKKGKPVYFDFFYRFSNSK